MTDEAAGFPLTEFEDMLRSLEPNAQAPSAEDFLAEMINRLRSGGSAEQNADLIQQLEELKADKDDANLLGFYAVMAVMAAAAGIAETIRTKTVNDACPKVTRQVQDFAQHVPSLLEHASPADLPQTVKLIAMARAAMKVPFEYLTGAGMHASLSHSMMNWSRTASGAQTKASQEQLEAALRSFLDALTGTQK